MAVTIRYYYYGVLALRNTRAGRAHPIYHGRQHSPMMAEITTRRWTSGAQFTHGRTRLHTALPFHDDGEDKQ